MRRCLSINFKPANAGDQNKHGEYANQITAHGLPPISWARNSIAASSWGFARKASLHPRNYEAGSPKVDLKVGQCPTFVDEFGLCRLTQNLTEKGVPGNEDIGIGFREIQDGWLCLPGRERRAPI